MFRRTAATLALTTALVAAGAGAASAHECFVANRSAQGNAGASNSANWYTLQMEELYRSGHFFLGGEPLTDAQGAPARAIRTAQWWRASWSRKPSRPSARSRVRCASPTAQRSSPRPPPSQFEDGSVRRMPAGDEVTG